MDTNDRATKLACNDMLQKISKNRRHRIKKKFFDPVEANQVSIESPVPGVSDGEWQALVQLWSTPRHKVCVKCPFVSAAVAMLSTTVIFICSCSVLKYLRQEMIISYCWHMLLIWHIVVFLFPGYNVCVSIPVTDPL